MVSIAQLSRGRQLSPDIEMLIGEFYGRERALSV